jgi:hypothetical protein
MGRAPIRVRRFWRSAHLQALTIVKNIDAFWSHGESAGGLGGQPPKLRLVPGISPNQAFNTPTSSRENQSINRCTSAPR